MALGGRIAELLVYGEINTGAYSDLSQVTRIAKAMVCEYGMSDRLGNRRFGRAQGSPFMGRDFGGDEADYSEEMARIVDEEISTIIDRNYARAEQILTENRHLLDRLTAELLDKETLDRDDFLALIQDAVVPATGGRTPKPPTPPLPPTAPPPVSDVSATDDAPVGTQQRLEPGLA